MYHSSFAGLTGTSGQKEVSASLNHGGLQNISVSVRQQSLYCKKAYIFIRKQEHYTVSDRASFNIATSGVSAPVGPSSGPVVKQKNLILPQ